MLDWFSQNRIGGQRTHLSPPPPAVGQILPDHPFQRPDGGLFFLSQLSGAILLLALPDEPFTPQAYLLPMLAGKLREVRPEITRSVVVARPEHLSTVVAWAGDMLILCDNTGEYVLQLAPENAVFYLVDAAREIRDIVHAGFTPSVTGVLWPAASESDAAA